MTLPGPVSVKRRVTSRGARTRRPISILYFSFLVPPPPSTLVPLLLSLVVVMMPSLTLPPLFFRLVLAMTMTVAPFALALSVFVILTAMRPAQSRPVTIIFIVLTMTPLTCTAAETQLTRLQKWTYKLTR